MDRKGCGKEGISARVMVKGRGWPSELLPLTQGPAFPSEAVLDSLQVPKGAEKEKLALGPSRMTAQTSRPGCTLSPKCLPLSWLNSYSVL